MGRSVRTLQTVNGKEDVACPLTHTWDAAIAIRDAVYRVPGFRVFIIPGSSSPTPLRTVPSRNGPGSAASRCCPTTS